MLSLELEFVGDTRYTKTAVALTYEVFLRGHWVMQLGPVVDDSSQVLSILIDAPKGFASLFVREK